MHRKALSIIGLFFSIVICPGTQCEKYVIAYQYVFVPELDVKPQQNSYHVLDTIWVSYTSADNTMKDKQTGERIRVDTLGFNLQMVYTTYNDTFVGQVPAGGICEYIAPATAILSQPPSFLASVQLPLGCNNPVNFRIGLVLKLKGRYKIFLNPPQVSSCTSSMGSNSNISWSFANRQLEYSVTVN